jgi:uncharacterized protein YqeY
VLREEINSALKTAMKARDERRVSTLRLINAAINNAEIEAEMRGRAPLKEDEVVALLQKMIKQRRESVEIYEKGGRQELADKERGEIEIIGAYLPKQLSEAETQAAIAEAIKAVGAQDIKDMGKVMAALKQSYAGKMDFSKAGPLVKAALAGS